MEAFGRLELFPQGQFEFSTVAEEYFQAMKEFPNLLAFATAPYTKAPGKTRQRGRLPFRHAETVAEKLVGEYTAGRKGSWPLVVDARDYANDEGTCQWSCGEDEGSLCRNALQQGLEERRPEGGALLAIAPPRKGYKFRSPPTRVKPALELGKRPK